MISDALFLFLELGLTSFTKAQKYKKMFLSNEVPQVFRDAIKEVLDVAGTSNTCPYCEKLFEKKE